MKLFAGNGCKPLADKITKILHEEQARTILDKFNDREIRFEVKEHVRGDDVFIIQSTCQPANDNIMELAIMVDALKRSDSGRIIAVIPYYGYSRQDRRLGYKRSPITSKLVATLLEAAGVQFVVTVDIHSDQQQGFFDVPFVNVGAASVFIDNILTHNITNGVMVSPDVGGVRRARNVASAVDFPLAIIDKRRPAPGIAEVHHIIGDVDGKTCLIVDDMVDTAGTLSEASHALKEEGAEKIYAYITHPVLSGDAIQNLQNSAIDILYTTDTIPLKPLAREYAEKTGRLKVLSMSDLLAEAIHRIHAHKSISEMYKHNNNKEEDVDEQCRRESMGFDPTDSR